ncbi:hypothetical protein N7528_004418 [Penicillium herquei]|nr:hypothetical protein N7528_004418 [Penicillium herquei]
MSRFPSSIFNTLKRFYLEPANYGWAGVIISGAAAWNQRVKSESVGVQADPGQPSDSEKPPVVYQKPSRSDSVMRELMLLG